MNIKEIGIVDSHFHIWDLNYLRYPWLDNRGVLNRSYLFDEYIRAAGKYNIEASVYCECSGEDYKKEIQYIIDQSRLHPQIRAAVSWCRLEDTEGLEAELERLKAEPLVRGVRRMLKKAPAREELCLSDAFIRGMRLLPRYDLIYDMGIVPCLMEPCYKMMRQCPETRFVVEHCAEPDISGNGFEEWASGMKLLAGLPNVFVKLSGFMTHVSSEASSLEEMRPYMEYTVEKFGFDRVMFGSDWPPVNQVSKLEHWIDCCFEVFSGESDENLTKLFRTTAAEFYGIQDMILLSD